MEELQPGRRADETRAADDVADVGYRAGPETVIQQYEIVLAGLQFVSLQHRRLCAESCSFSGMNSKKCEFTSSTPSQTFVFQRNRHPSFAGRESVIADRHLP